MATGWARFPAMQNVPLLHSFQKDSGALPASHPKGTDSTFFGGKAIGA
jgi:hypothetical protein